MGVAVLLLFCLVGVAGCFFLFLLAPATESWRGDSTASFPAGGDFVGCAVVQFYFSHVFPLVTRLKAVGTWRKKTSFASSSPSFLCLPSLGGCLVPGLRPGFVLITVDPVYLLHHVALRFTG